MTSVGYSAFSNAQINVQKWLYTATAAIDQMDKQEHIFNRFCEQLEEKHSANMIKTRLQMNNIYCYPVFSRLLLNLSGRILIASELFETTCMHTVYPPFKKLSYFSTNNNQSFFTVRYKFWHSWVVLFINNILNKTYGDLLTRFFKVHTHLLRITNAWFYYILLSSKR